MAMVFGAVQPNRGHVEAHSEPGRGTRIEIVQPAPARRDARRLRPLAPQRRVSVIGAASPCPNSGRDCLVPDPENRQISVPVDYPIVPLAARATAGDAATTTSATNNASRSVFMRASFGASYAA